MLHATTSSVVLIVVAIAVFPIATSSPLDALLEEYLTGDFDSSSKYGEEDYDLHYDQRQTGTENYRLNVDGVLIAVPAASDTAISSLSALATNYLADFAASAGNLDEGDDEDDDDDDAVVEEHVVELEVADKPYVFEKHAGKGATVQQAPTKSDDWQFKSGATSVVAVDAAGEQPGKKVGEVGSDAKRAEKSNGPIKKRKQHKLQLGSLIEYLKRRN